MRETKNIRSWVCQCMYKKMSVGKSECEWVGGRVWIIECGEKCERASECDREKERARTCVTTNKTHPIILFCLLFLATFLLGGGATSFYSHFFLIGMWRPILINHPTSGGKTRSPGKSNFSHLDPLLISTWAGSRRQSGSTPPRWGRSRSIKLDRNLTPLNHQGAPI